MGFRAPHLFSVCRSSILHWDFREMKRGKKERREGEGKERGESIKERRHLVTIIPLRGLIKDYAMWKKHSCPAQENTNISIVSPG